MRIVQCDMCGRTTEECKAIFSIDSKVHDKSLPPMDACSAQCLRALVIKHLDTPTGVGLLSDVVLQTNLEGIKLLLEEG